MNIDQWNEMELDCTFAWDTKSFIPTLLAKNFLETSDLCSPLWRNVQYKYRKQAEKERKKEMFNFTSHW